MPYIWSYLDTTMPTGAPAAEVVYQFDDTAESLDDRSANGHDLTQMAGPALTYRTVEGIKGGDFNALEYLEAPDSATLRTLGALTVELIVQPEENDSNNGAYTCQASGTNILYALRMNHFLHPAPGKWGSLHEYDAKINQFLEFTTGAPGGKDGRVALITLTRDSTGKIHRIYDNGRFFQEMSAANAPNTPTTQRLAIGADGEGTRWYGVIIGFRLTLSRFTDAQVAEAAGRVLTYDPNPASLPRTPALVALWRMDEGKGQDEPDRSGNNHLMVNQNQTTAWIADGKIDTARRSSSNNAQWICSTDTDDFNLQALTLIGWFRKTAATGLGYLLHKDHGGKLRSWLVQVSGAPHILSARVEFDDGTSASVNSTTEMSTVDYVLWTVVWTGTSLILYINAVEEDRVDTGPKTIDYQTGQNVAIGNVNNTLERPRGDVDSNGIYQGVLDEEWIRKAEALEHVEAAVSSFLPLMVDCRGGTLLNLAGAFPINQGLAVTIGGVPAYGGQGFGLLPQSQNGTTLKAVVPPLAVDDYDIVVDFATAPTQLQVREHSWSAKTFSSRKSHPPWSGVGPRRIDVSDLECPD